MWSGVSSRSQPKPPLLLLFSPSSPPNTPQFPPVNYSKRMPIIPPSCWLKTKPPPDKTTAVYEFEPTQDKDRREHVSWNRSAVEKTKYRAHLRLILKILLLSFRRKLNSPFSRFHFSLLPSQHLKCSFCGEKKCLFFSEMLDELQTTLPRSHLVYRSPGHARGSRNVSVCVVFSPWPTPTVADNVLHSFDLNN